MRAPLWLARLWILAGIVGALLSLVGMVAGWRLIGILEDSFERTFTLTAATLEAASDTTATALVMLSAADAGLDEVELSLGATTGGLERMATLTAELGSVLTVEVPRTLDAIAAAMPAMIDTARIVDGTMRALSFVGVDYDPAIPLDESLEQVTAALTPLAAELRTQAAPFAEVGVTLAALGESVSAVGEDLAVIGAEIDNSRSVLDRYEAAAAEATSLVADLRTNLDGQMTLMRFLIAGLGVVALVMMTVPISLGREAVAQKPIDQTPIDQRPIDQTPIERS
jgi:hypothetical protein